MEHLSFLVKIYPMAHGFSTHPTGLPVPARRPRQRSHRRRAAASEGFHQGDFDQTANEVWIYGLIHMVTYSIIIWIINKT